MVKKTDALPADIAALSFEDALKELETIVRQLEEGRGKLDDAIGSYVRGAALRRHCEAKLAEAKARIETISLDADGLPLAKPTDLG
jgi:exodeoxyribonuclease VII small subunit